MKSLHRLFALILALIILIHCHTLWAIRIFCPNCSSLVELTDTVCKKCGKELNKCLHCNTLNPLFADYCENCASPLAEMRVLGQIDEETRQELKLGQSERAQMERELQAIDYQMQKDPSLTEKLMFRKARIYRQMNFPAKEVATWQEYLQKFPNTDKKSLINIFLSEALRKWGYLFYMQQDPDTALQKYEAAVACNPANAEAWLWIGRIKNEKKDSEGAADAYMKALEAEPGNKIAINFLKSMKRKIPPELLKPISHPTATQSVSLQKLHNKPAGGTATIGFATASGAKHFDNASSAVNTSKNAEISPKKVVATATNEHIVSSTSAGTFETVEPEPAEVSSQTSQTASSATQAANGN